MSLEQFLRRALEPQGDQRKGQWFANKLYAENPRLSEILPYEIDPFYEDGNLWAAVEFVKRNWEEQ